MDPEEGTMVELKEMKKPDSQEEDDGTTLPVSGE